MRDFPPSQSISREARVPQPSPEASCEPRADLVGHGRPEPLHGVFPARMLVDPRANRKKMLIGAVSSSVTRETARFARLDKLHRVVDYAVTKVGSAALLRDILNPPTDMKEIEARREAIRELRDNKELRQYLHSALRSNKKAFFRGISVEDTALHVMAPELADHSAQRTGWWGVVKNYVRQSLNAEFEIATRISSLGKLLRSIEGCPSPSSPLLRCILQDIQRAVASPRVELLDGEAVVTRHAIGPRSSVGWRTPAFTIHGRSVNIEGFCMTAMYSMSAAVSLIGQMAGSLRFVAEATLRPLVFFASLMFLQRALVVNLKVAGRFQKQVTADPGVQRAVDSLGQLDALLSLAKFEERMSDSLCQPVLREEPAFKAAYKGMKHPVVAYRSKGCVPNDVSVNAGRVYLLTGPNSGGKTTIATALLQNQILAHLGTMVFAESATLSVADTMQYQGPGFKTVGKHGKYGTELAATRKIFMKATERSLVVLDEVGDGTNAAEGIQQTKAVLWGFTRIGAGTVVITHNRVLVRELEASKIGEPYQMNTIDGAPNFQLLPGISPHSHAAQVAAKLRFSPRHIKARVRKMVEKRAKISEGRHGDDSGLR